MPAAFLYPGQGVAFRDVCAYYAFLKNFDSIKTEEYVRILQSALDEINHEENFNIADILEKENTASFQKTSCAQPITFLLSLLTSEFLRNKGNKEYDPSLMLGHSLGAFSALTAAGSVTFEQGSRIVVARSKFMQEACELTDTGLFVILGLPEENILEICKATGASVALINAPAAYVLGAQRNIFAKIKEEADRLKAPKAFPLETSGAFHTPAMKAAYEKFRDFLSQYTFRSPQIPVVANIYKKVSSDAGEIKNDVVESMIHPINWVKMMEVVKNAQIDAFIECGPGTSLTSLGRMNGIPKEKVTHASTILS